MQCSNIQNYSHFIVPLFRIITEMNIFRWYRLETSHQLHTTQSSQADSHRFYSVTNPHILQLFSSTLHCLNNIECSELGFWSTPQASLLDAAIIEDGLVFYTHESTPSMSPADGNMWIWGCGVFSGDWFVQIYALPPLAMTTVTSLCPSRFPCLLRRWSGWPQNSTGYWLDDKRVSSAGSDGWMGLLAGRWENVRREGPSFDLRPPWSPAFDDFACSKCVFNLYQ